MDLKKIEEGVRLILEGIGEDPEREGLVETPERYARMCQQVFGGLIQTPEEHLKKQFTVDNNNMVLEKDITFYSTVSIISCLSTVKLMGLIFRTVKLQVYQK